MPSSHTRKNPVFPPALTWIGVLILGSGLTHSVVPSALASSAGISSATTVFSSFNADQGVFSGGQRRDFTSGLEGFGQGAFSALGSLAMERTLGEDENRRDEYLGSASSATVNQGGVSTWQNTGMFFPRHDQTLLLTNTVGLSGDTTTWSTRVESLIPGSMTNNRIVWDTRLAASFVPQYSTLAGGVVLVSDSSGTHPTVAMKATSTAGELVWGGPGGYLNPLTPGTLTPTVYVHSVDSVDFTISVVVTLVDHDPCSTSAALTLAGQVAGVVGSTSPTLSSCLAASTWSAPAGETTNLGLTLLAPAREIASGQTRVLQVEGLPAGARIDATALSGANSSVSFDLDVSVATEPGNYELSLVLLTATSIGGVESFSEPLTSRSHLTISPLVVPEPAGEEEPPLVVEPAKPEEQETPGTPPPARSHSAPPPLAENPVPKALERVLLPKPETTEPLLSPVIPEPKTTPDSSPQPYLEPVPQPIDSDIVSPPPPVAASTLLGVTMAGMLGLGSLFAWLRRRRNRARESG